MDGSFDYTLAGKEATRDFLATSTANMKFTATGSFCGKSRTAGMTGSNAVKAFKNEGLTEQIGAWIE